MPHTVGRRTSWRPENAGATLVPAARWAGSWCHGPSSRRVSATVGLGGCVCGSSATTTSLSWIPSDSVWGPLKLGFDLGLSHWDEPLPDRLAGVDEVQALHDAGRFRFANVLEAWAEVADGRDHRARVRRPLAACSWGRRPSGWPVAESLSRRSGCRCCGRPRSPTRRRWVGGVPADGGRADGDPAAPPRAAPAVRAVAGTARLDDARPDPARRRHLATRGWSGPARSRGTGSTAPTARVAWKSALTDESRLDASLLRGPDAVERPGP